MRIPTTALDERFSDPAATPTPWAATAQALADAQLFWLTTVRVDGRPHVTPLVAVWLDDALHFCTGAAEQKAVNLRHRPDVVLTTGRDEWEGGIDVVVEGRAVRATHADLLQRLAGAWRGKWDGQWQFEVRDGMFHHPDGGEAIVFTVAPDKVLTFAKGTFAQTRHVF